MDLSMGTETVVELQGKLKRYCLYLTDNHWDAEDLAQETWAKALSTSKVNAHSNPQALLLRIAKNSWIDLTRKRKLYLRYMEDEKNNIIQATEPDVGQLEMIFQALIRHMTPLQRAVFLLKDVYDYSLIETAHILNTTQGAVKASLHRARRSVDKIKHDLKEDTLGLPHEEGHKSLLLSLAVAYQIGDVARVLVLAMEGEVEETAALAIVHNQAKRVKGMARNAENIQGMWQCAAA